MGQHSSKNWNMFQRNITTLRKVNKLLVKKLQYILQYFSDTFNNKYYFPVVKKDLNKIEKMSLVREGKLSYKQVIFLKVYLYNLFKIQKSFICYIIQIEIFHLMHVIKLFF